MEELSLTTPITGSSIEMQWAIKKILALEKVIADSRKENAVIKQTLSIDNEDIVKIFNSEHPKKVTRLTRGNTKRNKENPITVEEIKDAHAISKSIGDVCRIIGVSRQTYKKYCKLLGIEQIKGLPVGNQVGRRGRQSPHRGVYSLPNILAGKCPNIRAFALKNRLIRAGVKSPVCEMCGYSERRISDGKYPLLLNFVDGNPKNHQLENMKIYCYNCSFTCGSGYLRSTTDISSERQLKYKFDPDQLQGSKHPRDPDF